ncbi:hypothetical protein BH23GEM3_BH23GEM3_14820 [soil metagenome]|nr:Spy/CpxP family protein refolding chaperone [Gemmatimonadota bacterium]
MKSSVYGLVLVAALAAAPVPAVAQQQTPATPRTEERGGMHKHEPGVGALLQLRGELQLTDAQVARLQAITQRLEAQNQPLLQRLRDAGIPVHPERRARVREMTPAQREDLKQKLEANRPTLQRLRENMHGAMRDAREVLTPEQQQRMRDLTREHRARQGKQGPHGRTGPKPGSRPDA